MSLWLKLAIVASVLALIFLIPITRQLFVFLLVPGTGIDDLILLLLVGAAIVLWWIGGWQELFKRIRGDK